MSPSMKSGTCNKLRLIKRSSSIDKVRL